MSMIVQPIPHSCLSWLAGWQDTKHKKILCPNQIIQSKYGLSYCISFADILRRYQCLKQYFHWQKLLAKQFVVLCLLYDCLTYLGHLGWSKTNRIISICVVLPKVAEASWGGLIALRYCQWLCQQTSNGNEALMESEIQGSTYFEWNQRKWKQRD